ncbi:DNA methylase [Phenylobacterium sp.]|jgi:hypothetical protein|uniref:DNA methylase n=1 Tax=Phenylobacterium sp. TaxID=1871053 RepID=UPI002F402E24
MTQALDDEDDELDRLWRARFGQPIPILGCSRIARALLEEPPPAADPQHAIAV